MDCQPLKSVRIEMLMTSVIAYCFTHHIQINHAKVWS